MGKTTVAKTKVQSPKTLLSDSRSVKPIVIKVKQFNYDVDKYTRLYIWLFTSVIKNYKFRKHPVVFIFEHGKTAVKMPVRAAIVNLIFWKPYCDTNTIIPIDSTIDVTRISEDYIAQRLDLVIDTFKSKMDIKNLCKTIRYQLESLAQIPLRFCKKIGNTMGLRDVIDLANNSKEFDQILHTHYPENVHTDMVEADINAKATKVVEIISNQKNSRFRPFFMAGGNVNFGQMSQCFVSIGPRSDIYGNISPVIVNTNFIHGLMNPSDYYLESFSCRKSLIANRYQMSDSGYTYRQMNLLCMDSTLVDVEDCGSPALLEMYIPDQQTLNMLEMKYYSNGKKDKNGKYIFKEIRPKVDTNLIGKTVLLRSAIGCSLPEGQICKTCYGGMSFCNIGYHTGILAAHCFTAPVGQLVLSTKHLIKTRTKSIDWDPLILKFFKCDTDEIYLKSQFNQNGFEIGFFVDDIDEYVNSIGKVQDDDDEDEISDTLVDYVTRIVINNSGEKTIIDNLDTELYINPEMLSKILRSAKIDDGVIYVSMNKYPDDTPVFDVNIENMEIGEYLKRIMTLLGVKSKTSYTTIEDLYGKICAAIAELGLKLNAVHIESIIYNMIRDPDMIIHRPKVIDGVMNNYTILPTCSSIMYSRALTTSLSFERLASQFGNPLTYYKTAEGYLDPLFK